MTRTVHPHPHVLPPPPPLYGPWPRPSSLCGPDRPAQGPGPRIAQMDGELSSFWIVVIHHL